jgi:hypothetical protein
MDSHAEQAANAAMLRAAAENPDARAAVLADTRTRAAQDERDRAAPDQLKAAVRTREAYHDAEVRAAAYREAADLAHAEGTRLYDDMGRHAAEGAWSVRDKLNARADQLDPNTPKEPTT